MIRRSSSERGFALWALLLIIVVAIIGLAALAGVLLTPRGSSPKPLIALFRSPPARSNLGDTFNILMSGRDARLIGDRSQDGKKRNRRETAYHSDMIIIAHVNLPLRRVTMVSIPRDFLVEIPGFTHAENRTDFTHLDKITHASAYGQDALLVKTIEKNLGIRISRHIALDFDSFRLGFKLLQPFLGKLVFGNRALTTPDSALLFVRDRHHFANDDLDRSRHAMLFVKTVLQRLWPKLDSRFMQWLLPQGLQMLGSDTDLSPDDLQYIIQRMKSQFMKPDSIETALLVGAGAPVTLWEYQQTLSCCIPAWNEVEKQVDFYLRDKRNVEAVSFMEEDQKIRWPGYVFENYDFMPDTLVADTTNPEYRRLMLEKDSLQPMDPNLRRIGDSLAKLPGAHDSSALPVKSKADTTHARSKTGRDTLKSKTKAKAPPDTTKKGKKAPPPPPKTGKAVKK